MKIRCKVTGVIYNVNKERLINLAFKNKHLPIDDVVMMYVYRLGI